MAYSQPMIRSMVYSTQFWGRKRLLSSRFILLLECGILSAVLWYAYSMHPLNSRPKVGLPSNSPVCCGETTCKVPPLLSPRKLTFLCSSAVAKWVPQYFSLRQLSLNRNFQVITLAKYPEYRPPDHTVLVAGAVVMPLAVWNESVSNIQLKLWSSRGKWNTPSSAFTIWKFTPFPVYTMI